MTNVEILGSLLEEEGAVAGLGKVLMLPPKFYQALFAEVVSKEQKEKADASVGFLFVCVAGIPIQLDTAADQPWVANHEQLTQRCGLGRQVAIACF